jgi:peptidylprolyl isomerase
VKPTTYNKRWLFAAILIMLIAVACGPATPKEDVEPVPVDEDTTEVDETAETAFVDPSTVSSEDNPLVANPAPVEPEQLPTEVDEADFETTTSGLRYYDMVMGEGDSPGDGDIVSIAYTMWLEDGPVFIDSTRGQTTDFILGSEQVFDGWNEGVSTMKSGGTRQLIIPPELALGEEGFGDFIPPNSTIILELELVDFRPSPKPTEVAEEKFETTETGLQYFDIEVGDGLSPENGDAVTIAFAIWLQEGTVYVAGSEDQGGTFNFTPGSGQVFPGWEEGVLTMAVGGSRQLIIPPELGLGEQGATGVVPPNSTLVLEMTLLSVSPAPKMTEVDEADLEATDSGLQFFDIEESNGASPTAGQTVVVHYSGWLEDGTLFDSSVQRGTPFEFVLGQGGVIQGWDEGVTTMQVGGKRQLVIPPELAYGETGSGAIPPGATLIFDIELLEIR